MARKHSYMEKQLMRDQGLGRKEWERKERMVVIGPLGAFLSLSHPLSYFTICSNYRSFTFKKTVGNIMSILKDVTVVRFVQVVLSFTSWSDWPDDYDTSTHINTHTHIHTSNKHAYTLGTYGKHL